MTVQMFSEMNRLTGLDANDIKISTGQLDIGKNGYSVQSHLQLLSKNYGDICDWNSVYGDILNYLRTQFEGILYPDTLKVLRELRERGNTLSIITFGGEDYQSLKLEATGLHREVDRTRIVTTYGQKPNALEEILQESHLSTSQANYVDDRLEELRFMREHFGPSLELRQIRRKPISEGRNRERVESYPTEEQEFKFIRSLVELL